MHLFSTAKSSRAEIQTSISAFSKFPLLCLIMFIVAFHSFSIKRLERTYLLEFHGRIIERPQFMFMRVAVAIHGTDLKRVLETYHMMSTKRFVHSSPTLFYAGTPKAQLSSCFLMPLATNNIEGVFKSISSFTAVIQRADGVGLNVNDISATGSVSIVIFWNFEFCN